MVAVSALVSGLDAELVRLGYTDSTMLWYRGCWRRLEKFFVSLGVEEFSRDLAMVWVDEACGFFGKEQAGRLQPNDVYLFRVAQMLGDYAVHGAVLRRYSRAVSRLAGDGADTIARFREWLQAAGSAVSTVRTYTTVAGEFVGFLDTRGGIGRCDAVAVQAFVTTLAGYQFKTVEQKLCAVRSFLRFAAGDGLLDAAVLDAVPSVKSRTQTRMCPVAWPPGPEPAVLMRIQTETEQLWISRPVSPADHALADDPGCPAPTRPPQQSYCARSAGLLGGRTAVLPTERTPTPGPAGREMAQCCRRRRQPDRADGFSNG